MTSSSDFFEDPSDKKKSTWLRWVHRGLWILLSVVGSVTAWEFFSRWQARQELDRIIAELDRTEPRWRLEDIEADRKQIPPEQNSALRIVEIRRLLPQDWKFSIEEPWDPPVLLRKEQLSKLAAELKQHQQAVLRARTLQDTPLGRHTIRFADDFSHTLIPDQQDTYTVVRLLDLDVRLQAEKSDMDTVWASNRAMLNAGRSLGDEPFIISMLIRAGIINITIESLEHILAQGELKDHQLKERQQELEKEATVPLFLTGMRGERAGIHHTFGNIESGKLSFMEIDTFSEIKKDKSNYWSRVMDFLSFSTAMRAHAKLLELHTDAIELGKATGHEKYVSINSLAKTVDEARSGDKGHALAAILFTSATKFASAEQRTHTRLACATAGLAAERFRLQKKRWPVSLDELAKTGFLKQVPEDLFDGKPLRFRRARDGFVIFSVGKDGNYDGTALDGPQPVGSSVDRVEFRLWDVVRRRQPPLPQKRDD
jgi:hypothetical protein